MKLPGIRPSSILFVLALCVPTASPANAQPKPSPSAKPASATSPPVAAPRLAAIAEVAKRVSEGLRGISPQMLVVAAPLESDAAAPRGAPLALAIANQIAGRLGPAARVHPEVASLSQAREVARREATFLHVVVSIAAGQLRVTADVYPVARTVWARVRNPAPAPIAHAFADAPLDAEVRSYLAPIPLAALRIDRGKNQETDVVALGCGDVDSDGSPEIVTVSRHRVTTLRLRGGRVAPIASRLWSDFAPVSPVPLREPFAFATLVRRAAPDGSVESYLDVASTDRAASVRLDRNLGVVRKLSGLVLPDADGTACMRGGGLWLAGELAPCQPDDPLPRTQALAGSFDAFASTLLFDARGEPLAVWAGREQGALTLRDGSGNRLAGDAVGAQLAVGDLDQNGDPDIVASLDVADPLQDAIVVREWKRPRDRAGSLVETFRLPAAAGVRAVAVCPPDGPGKAPFVAAVGDEIWVVR